MAYKSPRVDELFQKAKATADQDQRAAYYKEIQALVAQDLPRVSLVQYTYPRIWSKGWTGMFWEDNFRDKAPTHFFGFVRPQK